jgi:hypothetical protein
VQQLFLRQVFYSTLAAFLRLSEDARPVEPEKRSP